MKSKVVIKKKQQKTAPPIKRLYVAIRAHEVVFVSSSDESSLKDEAKKFLKEQDKYFQPNIEVKEITSKEEIPKDWRENYTLIWGSNEEMSASQFLDSVGSFEYQEYLRLKAKFG